jgi:energy-converting hydrogenase B subunit D
VTVSALQATCLLVVAVVGTLVVFTRDPLRQAAVAGIFGLALSALFLSMQAPDVALSQIAIGSIVVPVLVLLAMAKIREHDE